MNREERINKIREFCNNKHFDNKLVRESIEEFIEKHTELYGNTISIEDLFTRLEDNLDKIVFVGKEKTTNGELGEYKGRIADNTDVNEILLYFDEKEIQLSEIDERMWDLYTQEDKQKLQQSIEEKKQNIKSTLIHELTHAAYTIKDRYGIGEKHIFSETGKDLISGEYRQISGHSNNIEAIVNYISSRIEEKSIDEVTTYKEETKAIYILSEKIKEEDIVQAAWNSDEQQLKRAYIEAIGINHESGEKSYNDFQQEMRKLVITRQQNLNVGEKNKKYEQTLQDIKQIIDEQNQENINNTILEFLQNENEQQTNNMEDTLIQDESEIKGKLKISQKIALFLQKKPALMNLKFVDNFVHRQLDVLPEANQEKIKKTDDIENKMQNSQREEFIRRLSDNGRLRKLSQHQRVFEKEKIEELQKIQRIQEEVDKELFR